MPRERDSCKSLVWFFKGILVASSGDDAFIYWFILPALVDFRILRLLTPRTAPRIVPCGQNEREGKSFLTMSG